MRKSDRVRLALAGLIAPGHLFDSVREEGFFVLRKYDGDSLERGGSPYETIESGCNLMLTAGANAYHQRVVGVDGAAVTTLASTNARLAVGDGTAAVAAAQTDLQGTTKTRKLVDGVGTISGNQISFVSTFTTTDANHAWNEAGIANAGSGGVMFNRVVQSFGTKTSGLQWVLTGTLAFN